MIERKSGPIHCLTWSLPKSKVSGRQQLWECCWNVLCVGVTGHSTHFFVVRRFNVMNVSQITGVTYCMLLN